MGSGFVVGGVVVTDLSPEDRELLAALEALRHDDDVMGTSNAAAVRAVIEARNEAEKRIEERIEELRSLAQRLVDMDDPRGSSDRQTITLDALIEQARAALDGSGETR